MRCTPATCVVRAFAQTSAVDNMLRGAFASAATRVAGGAAVAAAAAPEVSHARSMQPRSVLPGRNRVSIQLPSLLLVFMQLALTFLLVMQEEEAGHYSEDLESVHVKDVSSHNGAMLPQPDGQSSLC